VEIPDLLATIADAMGADRGAVVKAPDGRPFTIADKGRPIAGIRA
jgi:hypothetical protein